MKVLWLLLILIFTSCAQRIKVPINRTISPEAIGGGFEVEYKKTGFSQGVLQLENGEMDNPLLMSKLQEDELYLGVGVSDNADLFVKIPKESASLVGVKVQLIGDPSKKRSGGHNLAFTLAMGSERDNFDEGLEITLKSDVQDYSIIHGYRLNDTFMVYEGLSFSNFSFSGNIKDAPATFSDDQFTYRAQNILGSHIGIEAGGAAFKVRVEMGFQQIQWSNTERKTFSFLGYSLSSTF
jgi:hypothetical protein